MFEMDVLMRDFRKQQKVVVLDRPRSRWSAYLRSLLWPRAGVDSRKAAPPISLAWRGLRIDDGHLGSYLQTTGGTPSEYLPIEYPLSFLFHYHLSVVAHRDFPLSLRTLLGLRTHINQRRRLHAAEALDLDVYTGAVRILSKGVEVDLHAELTSGGEPVWENLHVYYVRGPFGGTDSRPELDLEPAERPELEASWQAPKSGGLAFGRLCGDFNPVHYFSPFARLLGFERAFCHTQRIIAGCVGRVPNASQLASVDSVRLDVAFKGPVYYGDELLMKSAAVDRGYRFDVYAGSGEKPAMPGRIVTVGADLRI